MRTEAEERDSRGASAGPVRARARAEAHDTHECKSLVNQVPKDGGGIQEGRYRPHCDTVYFDTPAGIS